MIQNSTCLIPYFYYLLDLRFLLWEKCLTSLEEQIQSISKVKLDVLQQFTEAVNVPSASMTFPKNRLLYSVALILRKGVIKRLHYYLNKQIYLTFIRHKINQQIYGHPVKMVLPATDPANLDQSATAI